MLKDKTNELHYNSHSKHQEAKNDLFNFSTSRAQVFSRTFFEIFNILPFQMFWRCLMVHEQTNKRTNANK